MINDFVKISDIKPEALFNGKLLVVPTELIKELAQKAFYNIAFYLSYEHLKEIADIACSKDATENEKFVCQSLIKNAIISAEGQLPLCQDTGTATVFAWRGEQILTGADEYSIINDAIKDVWQNNSLRFSQMVPKSMFEEENSKTNLPAQIDISYQPGNEYNFLFMAKGGGSSNKTVLIQGTKALLNEKDLTQLLKEKIASLGVAACPPYTLAVVIGGTSPENNLKTLKLATTGWLDSMNTKPLIEGYRDKTWEEKLAKIAAESGWGAQFGGKYLAAQTRVIRLPRHAGSCPISIGVSCNAHRSIAGKINKNGAFLQKLETNPAKLLEQIPELKLQCPLIDLDQPMGNIQSNLSKYKPGTMVKLNGTMIVARDLAHAHFAKLIRQGEKLPDYLINHPIYYAGPAKTPDNHVIGSFGPTTAQRMDQYVPLLMQNNASLVTLAKGNRSETVIDACKKFKGFYLGTIGGAAALLAKEHIIESQPIDLKQFGMEAVFKIRVKDLPAFIIYDDKGKKFY